MMWYEEGPGWGGWLLMTVGMVAIWALVAITVIALVRGVRNGPETSTGPGPRRLPDERFARGEIDARDSEARRARW